MTLLEYQILAMDRPDLDFPTYWSLSTQDQRHVGLMSPEEAIVRRAAIILRRIPGSLYNFDPFLVDYDPKQIAHYRHKKDEPTRT